MMPRTVLGTPRSTCSHSSPATGCVGLGNHPERLATSRAAPVAPWMSLMEEAEIWESGRRPESIPCISEHGASERRMDKQMSYGEAKRNWHFKAGEINVSCCYVMIEALGVNNKYTEYVWVCFLCVHPPRSGCLWVGFITGRNSCLSFSSFTSTELKATHSAQNSHSLAQPPQIQKVPEINDWFWPMA